jgi:hypothetical protein
MFGKMMTLYGNTYESGYIISDIREAGATEEHMRMHPKFFRERKRSSSPFGI